MPIEGPVRAMVVLGCVLLGTVALDAQPAIWAKLAAAKTVTCSFTVHVSGNWKDGLAEGAVKPAKLSVQFIDVNTEEGTARMVSGYGNYDIIVRFAQTSLHFVQSFREGPLYTTTIFDKETRDGKLKAVHTRHEYAEVSLPGFTSRPEQYYGECELGQ